jgi:hypothetical protein
MVEPIANTSSEFIGVNESLARQAPKGHGANFTEIVKQGSTVLMEALTKASTILPDGGLLAAALRGGQELQSADTAAQAAVSSVSGEDPRAPGAGSGLDSALGQGNEFSEFWKMQKEGQLMNVEFLKIQEALSRENRVFSTLSNVLKARHETTRNAINNIR